MFQGGRPNLSEAERTRSPGVVVVFYADDDDYRCRWFSELDFWDAKVGNGGETFSELWSDGEPVTVDARLVRSYYLPQLLNALRITREAVDEPPHLAYEVYWRGVLITQIRVEDDNLRYNVGKEEQQELVHLRVAPKEHQC